MGDIITIKHEGGTRFSARARDFEAVTGRGDGDDPERDNMAPGELFAASLGMCIGITLLAYCRNHGVGCEQLSIELERVHAEGGKRLQGAKVKAVLPTELSEKDKEVLHRVAHRCYVHQSIQHGIELDVSISATESSD